MSARNTDLIRSFFEEADTGRTPVELLAPGFTAHFPGMPTMDKDAFDQFETGFHAAFGHRHHLDEVVAEANRVAVRLRVTGTHAGEFMGVPASGEDITVEGSAFLGITDGRIAEIWGFIDQLGLLQQIGALPAPETAG